MGHETHPEFHDFHRPHQFDLRLFDLLRLASLFPRDPAGVSYRMVRRIACYPNARAFSDSYRGKSTEKQAKHSLAITTILIVIIGVVLPFSPLAKLLNFTPLPGPFFTFLAISTITYLLLVEWAKRLLFSRVAA